LARQGEFFVLAAAAANRRVVERNVAATAGFEALRQALAASLNDLAAGLVAALASDAHAVLRRFAGANAADQAALANVDAVERAVAGASSVAQHLAQVLQGGGGDFVIANAL
jgi:hypothetical protein